MSESPTAEASACALCGGKRPELLRLGGFDASACRGCMAQLGRLLLDAPETLIRCWPLLAEDDDGEPEPRIRRSDGSTAELREVTAELKRELSIEQRVQLAEM